MLEATVGIILFLVGGGIAAYLLLMIYYPEWVGISGKGHQKIVDEHQEGSKSEDPDYFKP